MRDPTLWKEPRCPFGHRWIPLVNDHRIKLKPNGFFYLPIKLTSEIRNPPTTVQVVPTLNSHLDLGLKTKKRLNRCSRCHLALSQHGEIKKPGWFNMLPFGSGVSLTHFCVRKQNSERTQEATANWRTEFERHERRCLRPRWVRACHFTSQKGLPKAK